MHETDARFDGQSMQNIWYDLFKRRPANGTFSLGQTHKAGHAELVAYGRTRQLHGDLTLARVVTYRAFHSPYASLFFWSILCFILSMILLCDSSILLMISIDISSLPCFGMSSQKLMSYLRCRPNASISLFKRRSRALHMWHLHR